MCAGRRVYTRKTPCSPEYTHQLSDLVLDALQLLLKLLLSVQQLVEGSAHCP